MAALLLAAALVPAAAGAQPPALGGLDVVSLRDSGRTIMGQPAISTNWRGQAWLFSNAANRQTFEADPRAYAPALGGYCPVTLAEEGRRQPGNMRLFVVIGDSLYLTASPEARDKLETNHKDILSRARAALKRLGG